MTCHEESPMYGMNFPMKLYQFLGMVDELNIANIISWHPNGRCIRIDQPNEFIKLTKPSWFAYAKYSSFQRQLNIYGFQRILDGADKNCYYHYYFQRDHPNLLSHIDRIPLKKGYKSSDLPTYVPDSISMSKPTVSSATKPKGSGPNYDGTHGKSGDVTMNHARRQVILGPLNQISYYLNDNLMSMQLHHSYYNDRVGNVPVPSIMKTLVMLDQLKNMQLSLIRPVSLEFPQVSHVSSGQTYSQHCLGSTSPPVLGCNRYGQFRLSRREMFQMLQLQSREMKQAVVSRPLLPYVSSTNQSIRNVLEQLHATLQS